MKKILIPIIAVAAFYTFVAHAEIKPASGIGPMGPQGPQGIPGPSGSSTPVVMAYSPTNTPDASVSFQNVTLTGDMVLNSPTNAQYGMSWQLWATCDTNNHNFTFAPSIVIPSDSSFASPKLLTSNKTYIILLKYVSNGVTTNWGLASIVGGY